MSSLSLLTLTFWPSRPPALLPWKLSGCLLPDSPVELQKVSLLGTLVEGILITHHGMFFIVEIRDSPFVAVRPEPSVDIDRLESCRVAALVEKVALPPTGPHGSDVVWR